MKRSSLIAFGTFTVSIALVGCASNPPKVVQPVTTTGAAVQPEPQGAYTSDQASEVTKPPETTQGGVQQPSGEVQQQGGGMTQGQRDQIAACPMNVSGATVSAANVTGGGALDFTTKDQAAVDELRARVHRMAAMQNQGGCRMLPSMSVPRSSASVVNVEGGARLIFRPLDASQLDVVRDRVNAQAQQLAQGCPTVSP